MSIYSFENITPIIHPTTYVHPQASVIGDVWIGKNCYIGPFASLRGDFNRIVLEDGCNVQDSCTIHGYTGYDCTLEQNVHLGHGCIVHSAFIKRNVMIGMQAVIMDCAEIGENTIVGAQSLVTTGETIPANSLFVGSPGKVIKSLSKDAIAMKSNATAAYQKLAEKSLAKLQIVELDECYPSDLTKRKKQRTYWDKIDIFTTK